MYDLAAVHLDALLRLAVGQLNDMDWLKISQHLKHFLFAVTGGLAYDQVRKIEEGTFIRTCKAVAGFDQGTEISGKLLFCIRDGFIRYRAQADHSSSHSLRDLSWEKSAEHADYRCV